MLVALDTLDDSLDSGKVTVDNLDTMSFFVEKIVGLQEHDRVVLTGGYAYEVLHLVIGHTENMLVPVVGEVVGHVTHGFELTARHLQLGENLLCGVDEQEVGYGGDEGAFLSALGCRDEFIAHGQEILNVQAVEMSLDLLLATIGNAHGEP